MNTPDMVRYPITGYREAEKRVLDAELKNARAQLAERHEMMLKALTFRDGAVALVAHAEQALRAFRSVVD